MFAGVMSFAELARELGIHPVTVAAAVEEGLLPRRHANGRAVVLSADVTDEVVAVLVESDAELALDDEGALDSEGVWDDLDSDDEDDLDEDEFAPDDDGEIDEPLEDDDLDDEPDVDVD